MQYRRRWIITQVIILEVSSTDGSLLSRGRYMVRYQYTVFPRLNARAFIFFGVRFTRRLNGAGVYFSLLAPAPYKLHWIDTELRRSCLLWSSFGHINSLQLHRYIVRSLALRRHQAHARRVGGRHLRMSTNHTTWTLPLPSVWPGV